MREKITVQRLSTSINAILTAISSPHFFIISLCFFCVLSWCAEASAEWVKRYNGPQNGSDKANGIAVDSSGNVYVTGELGAEAGTKDYATVKYDTNGKREWVRPFNSWRTYSALPEDVATAIAVDNSGNVYVTGNSCPSASDCWDWDYATIKYDTTGKRLWVAWYDATAGFENYEDEANAVAVDISGNVYVTGRSVVTSGQDDWDYATVKYDPNGKRKWVKRYNGVAKGNEDCAKGMVVDKDGNVYVTGYSTGVNSDVDYATIKYNTNGNQLWVKRYNGPGNDSDAAIAIAVDSSSNVYVTGYSTSSSGDRDCATIKYDTNGNQVWVKRYDGGVHRNDESNAIAVDKNGNVYVTGYSTGVDYNSYYTTIKYDTSGNRLWVNRYKLREGRGKAISIDSTGNVYVTGYSLDISYRYNDCTTIKYNTNGNQIWLKRYNGPANGKDEANAIAMDKNDNVYLTGRSVGNDTGDDYFTIKYDNKGN